MSSPAEKFLQRFEATRAAVDEVGSQEKGALSAPTSAANMNERPMTFSKMKADLAAAQTKLSIVGASHRKELVAVRATAASKLDAAEARYREHIARERSLNASLTAELDKERESARTIMTTLREEAADYHIEIKRQIKNASDVTSSGERLAIMAQQSLTKARKETESARSEVREMKKTLKLKKAGRFHETLLTVKRNAIAREKKLHSLVSHLQSGKLESVRKIKELTSRISSLESDLAGVEQEREALRRECLAMQDSPIALTKDTIKVISSRIAPASSENMSTSTATASTMSARLRGPPPSSPAPEPPLQSSPHPPPQQSRPTPRAVLPLQPVSPLEASTPVMTSAGEGEHPLFNLQQSLKRLRNLDHSLQVQFRDENPSPRAASLVDSSSSPLARRIASPPPLFAPPPLPSPESRAISQGKNAQHFVQTRSPPTRVPPSTPPFPSPQPPSTLFQPRSKSSVEIMEKKDRELEMMQLKIQLLEATSAASQAASAAQLAAERVHNSPRRKPSTVKADEIQKLSNEITKIRSELATERAGSFASQKLSQELAEIRGELHALRLREEMADRKSPSRHTALSTVETLRNRIAVLEAKLTAEKEYRDAFETMITSMETEGNASELMNSVIKDDEDAFLSDDSSVDISLLSAGALDHTPQKRADSRIFGLSDQQPRSVHLDLTTSASPLPLIPSTTSSAVALSSESGALLTCDTSNPIMPSPSKKENAGKIRKSSLSAPLNSLNAIHKAFALIDKNNDREITRIEVIKSLRKNKSIRSLLGLGTIRQEDGSRDKFEKIFQSMDIDESGSVNRDEFTQFFGRLREVDRDAKTSDFMKNRRLSRRISESKRNTTKVPVPMTAELIEEEARSFSPSKISRAKNSSGPVSQSGMNTSLLGKPDDDAEENDVTGEMARWMLEQLENGNEISEEDFVRQNEAVLLDNGGEPSASILLDTPDIPPPPQPRETKVRTIRDAEEMSNIQVRSLPLPPPPPRGTTSPVPAFPSLRASASAVLFMKNIKKNSRAPPPPPPRGPIARGTVPMQAKNI